MVLPGKTDKVLNREMECKKTNKQNITSGTMFLSIISYLMQIVNRYLPHKLVVEKGKGDQV
jgi:hypothetical protein